MAATLENTFVSRGVCRDLAYACYNNGGVDRYYFRITSSNELFPDNVQVGDFVFICMSNPFSGWEAVDLNPIVADSYTLAYKYWNGSDWVALPDLSDGTNQLSQNGQITWTQPTDWETWRTDGNYASKSSRYAQYLVKVEITALSNWTDGGYLNGYQKVKQKYISVNDGDSHTPASLYSDDQTNGWGVITKKGDFAYDISCGVYLGNCTFTFDYTKIKVGDAGSPNYVPFMIYNTIMLCNGSSTHLSAEKASSLVVYSKGNEGTVSISPSKDSKLFNLYFVSPWDTHYTRFQIGTHNGSGQVQWYNVLIGSLLYPLGSHYFNRVNFQSIQYLLSAGDTIYDNCIFGTTFNKDPGHAPVVLRPTFDGGNSDTDDWIRYFYPDTLSRQHHMDVVSGKWTKGNKWKCFCDDAYPDSTTRSHIMVYSQFLSLGIVDKDGNALSGVSLKLTDKYGNNGLWENLDCYMASNFSDAAGTTCKVSDGTKLNIGDIILYWGEILKVVGISGNTITWERGTQAGSARVYNLNDFYVPLRRRVSSMTIDGSKREIYVLERVYYKYSLDGGNTSTGNVYRDYNPYTLTISKPGYQTYQEKVIADKEMDWMIALEKVKISVD